MSWKINSSNPGKVAEFQEYLGSTVEIIRQDLAEPDADPLTIIRYKASQFDNVLVDDVSLEIEGAQVGTHIRWLLKDLPRYIGQRAVFLCLLGRQRDGQVEIYRGVTPGQIVAPRGTSFGFNPFFLADGQSKTFGEEISAVSNPRRKAIADLLAERPWQVLPPLVTWSGNFQ